MAFIQVHEDNKTTPIDTVENFLLALEKHYMGYRQ